MGWDFFFFKSLHYYMTLICLCDKTAVSTIYYERMCSIFRRNQILIFYVYGRRQTQIIDLLVQFGNDLIGNKQEDPDILMRSNKRGVYISVSGENVESKKYMCWPWASEHRWSQFQKQQ